MAKYSLVAIRCCTDTVRFNAWKSPVYGSKIWYVSGGPPAPDLAPRPFDNDIWKIVTAFMQSGKEIIRQVTPCAIVIDRRNVQIRWRNNLGHNECPPD